MAEKEIQEHIVHKLARFGCFSIGLVYLLVGVLAILSFMGKAQPDADEARMIGLLLDYRIGEVLVWTMLAGMVGYIIWRVFEAITDPYNLGNNFKGIVHRLGVAASGMGYGVVVYAALQLLTGEAGNEEQERQQFIATVLNWNGGRWLIALTGVVIAVAGGVQFKYAWSKDYSNCLDVEELSEISRKLIHVLAWAGYFARGIILLVLAYFFVKGALQHDSREVGDTDSAFDFLGGGGSLAGAITFNLVALGTICYGVFMFITGAHYKFRK